MKKILIIEDSKFVNFVIKNELDELGHKPYQAFDFKTAKKFLSKVKFDLIILDLHLPDGEGYELIDNIRNLTDTKIVVLTGNTQKQLRENLFQYGILDYIIKDQQLSFAIKEIDKILTHIDAGEADNILVIDDSNLMCKQISMLLTPRNYNVTTVKTAQEGLDLLEQNHFDLITLDMELPDMHGSEVLTKIKSDKRFMQIPVLIISGNTDPDVIRSIYKKGGSDYIRKPFILEEFVLKVDLWVDYRKKHLEALKQKDILLSQQSKLATMGEMLENIIHQSRQPLSTITAITSGLELEQECGILTDETLNEKIKDIENSAVYLSDTMGSFRDFYQTNDEKIEFDLTELFEKSFKLTESKFKTRNINIETNFEKITGFGFDIELLQVFINILNNARDEFEKQDLDNNLIIITTKINDDNLIEISMQDNAGGIPEDIIDKVFDSHFTTKDKSHGTGIGLFMSQEIVQKHHNGTIKVQNNKFTHNKKKYKGAEFKITLPLS
jgi:DNA-binding response OmpR family regulator